MGIMGGVGAGEAEASRKRRSGAARGVLMLQALSGLAGDGGAGLVGPSSWPLDLCSALSRSALSSCACICTWKQPQLTTKYKTKV